MRRDTAGDEFVKGRLCLVLHTHLPYVHHPDYEDFLEEDWLFEAIIECYLPLLDVLRGLRRDKVHHRIAFSLTPPLIHMLQEEGLRVKFERFLDGRRRLAEALTQDTKGSDRTRKTAQNYVEVYERLANLWTALGRDIVGAFASEQANGSIEILASSATHGFLPFLGTEAAQHAQVALGQSLYRKTFDRAPRGFWLPECAYAPGLDHILADAGIEWFILDRHGVTDATPNPRRGQLGPLKLPSGPVAFGRDPECSEQVWSSEVGYPGDPIYRELYRDIGYDADYAFIRPYLKPDGIRRNVGLKFHQVTGDVALDQKKDYDPEQASERADIHAGNFLFNRGEQMKSAAERLGTAPVLTAPYDTELFGHWWFEGPQFLDRVFRRAHDIGEELPFAFATPSEVIDEGLPHEVGEPAFSSWGKNGYGEVWLNSENQWIWPHIHEAERRMTQWANRHHESPFEGDALRLLQQMGRELLLAESSDWPFIITMETAAHYAERRLRDHIHRFFALEKALSGEAWDGNELQRIEATDRIFADLDPSIWRDHDGREETG